MDTATTTIEPTAENFDIFAMLEGTPLPVEEVTIFVDTAAAIEYSKLVAERQADEDKGLSLTADLAQARDEKIAALQDRLRKSALVFGVRGIAPGIVNEILAPNGETTTDVNELKKRDNELIARSIVSVKNHAGATDPRIWDAEQVDKFRTLMNEGEFGRLVAKIAEVNFTAAAFDSAADAGFPRGRVDVA